MEEPSQNYPGESAERSATEGLELYEAYDTEMSTL